MTIKGMVRDTGEHRVVTSIVITTLVVSSRAMEVNLKQVQTRWVRRKCAPQPTQVGDVPAARSSYATECEQTSPGRSPDSWLQTLSTVPSHSFANSGMISSLGRGWAAHQLQ